MVLQDYEYFRTEKGILYNGDCLDVLKQMPNESINCCVTSPPYFGLRNYGNDAQIGLEETPKAYVDKLVAVFREIKRILRSDGTLWLNLGDSYNGSGKAGSNPEYQAKHTEFGKPSKEKSRIGMPTNIKGLKSKDLIGIPWRVAFALQADGWYLRQDIIWHKPNPMPESVTDRCTKSHEYIFLLSKSQKYYFDNEAIKEPLADSSIQRLSQDIDNQNGSDRVPNKTNGNMKAVSHKKLQDKGQTVNTMRLNRLEGIEYESLSRNKRSVWTVTTKPYSEAHFATYPQDLIKPCVLAGCPKDGVVFDPFSGAGTTALVAEKLGRRWMGIELNADYCKLSKKRIETESNQMKLF